MHLELFNHLEGLKKVSPTRYKALCPMHSEKTPSFNINIADDSSLQIHCFGCGCNGIDVYKFFGLSFNELFGDKPNPNSFNKPTKIVLTKNIRDEYFHFKIFQSICQASTDRGENISLEDYRLLQVRIDKMEQIEQQFPEMGAYKNLHK